MGDHLNIEGNELKIRVLQDSEMPKAVQMFVDIFQKDDLYHAIFREDGAYSNALYEYFELMTRIGLKYHQVFIAGDFVGGSIFFPPSISHISIFEQLLLIKKAVKIYSFRKLIPSFIEMNSLEGETPHDLHYYLFLVGRRQEAGFAHQGIGKSLVLPTLKECDRIQVPCYAEFTSDESSAWGEKIGFKMFKDVKLRFHPNVLIRLGVRDPLPE